MFRARLLLAIAMLGLLALMEGAAALWAQHSAAQQVQRGRLASDVLKGYVELAANKQRLRSWTVQHLLAADAAPAVRDGLLAEMRAGLARTYQLSLALDELEAELGEPGRRAVRQQSLSVLDRHLGELGRALGGVRPLQSDANAAAAWRQIAALFDESQGQDLRRLLNAEIEAERQATEASRRDADQALATMRQVVIVLSVTALLATIGLAMYFMHRLKTPIDDLTGGALALRQGELSHRIPERQLDEFGEVARSFNAMAAELQLRRAQEQADRARLEEMVQSRTAELRAAHETLQALDLRRRRFFAEVSHELRTPATAIRGEAEVALRGREKTGEEYRQALARIVATVGQFSHVVEDLTLLARSEFDQLVVRREPLDWRALLQQCCEQAQKQAEAERLRFDWRLPEPGPERALLLGDGKRLRQLLGIVLDNARRYSHARGRIELAAELAGEALRLRVLDQGIGIAAQELAQVFERHFRGEAARAHRPDGLGLGLPIAQAIVQAHGGRIELRSAAGQGAEVLIELPLGIAGKGVEMTNGEGQG
ncbi:HAMP domain-containing histidine kinase [Roseateles sp. DAIF2]|uniref:sensor histidine kinase n=1 Tax=Roseateles sp. DAIF2 TaxID=2714952 RepID=UPI0018A2B396|nr:HAMP domain-containing sensor histidine kinase [Roseateles sp. DAIF2]QPF72652.1 HAMP domain-containing histidine kinase [Roseateles sp. DAIF2]